MTAGWAHITVASNTTTHHVRPVHDGRWRTECGRVTTTTPRPEEPGALRCRFCRGQLDRSRDRLKPRVNPGGAP